MSSGPGETHCVALLKETMALERDLPSRYENMTVQGIGYIYRMSRIQEGDMQCGVTVPERNGRVAAVLAHAGRYG
ncbi:hypothetical protein MBOL_15240 [Mycobacteroides abscessus subsp. bolletii BD]|nr:hypothetical protein MBOL_15240 [Mycobacteroides abscessus subsp. bolletii BD]